MTRAMTHVRAAALVALLGSSAAPSVPTNHRFGAMLIVVLLWFVPFRNTDGRARTCPSDDSNRNGVPDGSRPSITNVRPTSGASAPLASASACVTGLRSRSTS